MIRVAHIIDVMSSGGIEAVVMNYYRNVDKSKVQFDFIVSDKSTLPQKEEIEKLGGRIFVTPRVTKLFAYKKALKKIFKENNYQIVHCHMGALAMFPLSVAKKCKVPVRICHAHSTASKKELVRTLIKNILKPFAKKNATHYFACSEHAGRWLFGSKTFESGKVKVLNNAIDLSKFAYNEEIRKDVRSKLKLDDKFVVGHIGRFNEQKNHAFLIDIFAEIAKKKQNAVLLLVGEGPLEEEIKNKVKILGLENKVKFLGVMKDTSKIYQAFDVFVLPSLYEGLPVVGVEAQASGTNCYVSTTVSKELEMTDNIKFVSLEEEPKVWAEEILKIDYTKNADAIKELTNHGYNIKNEATKLQEFYLEKEL